MCTSKLYITHLFFCFDFAVYKKKGVKIMLQYAPILHICNVNECERNLDFGEKSCIFVIAYRGE